MSNLTQLTIFEIEEKIKKHKAELAQLEKNLDVLKLESPERQLARELHNIVCTLNHGDGCGWFYEMKNQQDDWTGYAHGQYLKKANMLTHKCKQQGQSVEQAIEMFKLIREI